MEFNPPQRPKNSHKGTFGKVLNIAGSYNYSGAAYLSSIAALKVGCGLVTLAAENHVIQVVASQTPDVVFLPMNEVLDNITNYTTVSIGCGLATNEETKELFIKIIKKLKRTKIPTVIDASGLTLLAQTNLTLNQNFIITPHIGEVSRLLNVKPEEIITHPDFWVQELGKKYNCIALIKGANTRVYKTDKKIYINNSGCSALAKAGSGDVLCGMLAGLLAQGMSPFEATKLAVYWHGKTGEVASEQLGEYSVLASDLLRFISNKNI